MLKVSAPELVGGTSGDSERSIRELFQQVRRNFRSRVDMVHQAKEDARSSDRGVIMFIDEVDVITVSTDLREEVR